MALDKPTQKMSKSHPNPKSRILLTDSRDQISKKLRVALTDSLDGVSYDPVLRPGVSNLIEIAFNLDHARGASSTPAEYAAGFEGLSLKGLKEKVADVVDAHLAPIRERYDELVRGDGRELSEAVDLGPQKANASAAATMELVRRAVGLE